MNMSDCLRKKTGNGKFHPWYQQYFKHVKASRHVRYLKIGKTNLNLYIVSKLRQISSPYLSKYYQTRLIFSRVQIFGFNIKMKALTFAILIFVRMQRSQKCNSIESEYKNKRQQQLENK